MEIEDEKRSYSSPLGGQRKKEDSRFKRQNEKKNKKTPTTVA